MNNATKLASENLVPPLCLSSRHIWTVIQQTKHYLPQTARTKTTLTYGQHTLTQLVAAERSWTQHSRQPNSSATVPHNGQFHFNCLRAVFSSGGAWPRGMATRRNATANTWPHRVIGVATYLKGLNFVTWLHRYAQAEVVPVHLFVCFISETTERISVVVWAST